MAMISHSKIDSKKENAIIEDNMGLIVNVVKTFNPTSENLFEEYIQAGRIGLLKAIRTSNKTCPWSTMAWNNVKWSILNYINEESEDETIFPITVEPSGNTKEEIYDYIPSNLLDREKEVLQLRIEGNSFKDIGAKLGYSKNWAHYVFYSGVRKIRNANEILFD